MNKIIMHIDLNQFYAAATCLLEPELKGKPLIIASDTRRGIVSTASYEARKYGIHSAMPTYMAKKLCPNVIIRNVNFDWYNKKSNEFFSFIKNKNTDKIEIASIDECFVDMTDIMQNMKRPLEFLKSVQEDIYMNTHLDASIGLGSTKFIAKMASDYKKPKGITIIRNKDIEKYLYHLPIKDFYGIGKKTWPKLNEIGIYTIGDFALSNNNKSRQIMGKFYDVAKEWINGKGDDEINNNTFDPKSISSTSTLLFDTNDYEEIRNSIEEKCREVSHQAENENKIGKTILLILKDSQFRSITRSITINKPTNSFVDIYTNAINLFDKFFDNQTIRLAGVGLSQLINKEDFFLQISLFDQEKNQKECATRLLINKLNRKANKELFMTASQIKKDK